MNKYTDYLKKKQFPIIKEISKEEFLMKKAEMSEDIFNEQFYQKESNDNMLFYEIVAGIPSDVEYTIYLLDDMLSQEKEMLKQQKEMLRQQKEILKYQSITAQKTKVIAGIVIFWLICSIVSGIYIAITLGNLF